MFARLFSRLGLRRRATSRPTPALVIERVSDALPSPFDQIHHRYDPDTSVFPVWPAFNTPPDWLNAPPWASRCVHLIKLLCERGELGWELYDWFLCNPPTRRHEHVWMLFEKAAVALLKAPEETEDDPITAEDVESLTLKFAGSKIIKEGANQ